MSDRQTIPTTKWLRIMCEWRSFHVVEVPVGTPDDPELGDLPKEVLEEMNTSSAELYDFSVKEVRP